MLTNYSLFSSSRVLYTVGATSKNDEIGLFLKISITNYKQNS